MIFDAIYLLIYNNLQCLYTKEYLIEFSQTLLLLLSIYTLPIFIFESVVGLSDINIVNNVSYLIYKYLYFLPSYATIYILHNSKLSKLLEKKYTLKDNPHHLYLSILYGFTYMLCGIISNLFGKFYFILYICDTLSISLFYNEVAYCYMDNSIYYYNNRLDFFNNNYVIFGLWAIVTSLIINSFSIFFFIPGSYLVISIIQNIFINYKFKPYNPNITSTNIMYYIEKIINIIITFVSTFIFFSFQKRSIISEPI